MANEQQSTGDSGSTPPAPPSRDEPTPIYDQVTEGTEVSGKDGAK